MFPYFTNFEWNEDKEYSAPPCGLYITASPLLNDYQSIDKIRAIFNAINALPYTKNMHIFQLQTYGLSEEEILISSDILTELCHHYRIIFLIDNHIKLVKQTGADGIYIDKPELLNLPGTLAECRAQLGDEAIIGVNCTNSRQTAMLCSRQAVDFVLFETFFAHSSQRYNKATPELIEWWSTFSHIFSVAKGNITDKNCTELIMSGANFVCFDSYIWHQPSPERAITMFFNMIEKSLMQQMKH
jgi:thiamine-phosphate pyrophosphorylase